MARPVPGRTGDEREPLASAGVRDSSIYRGSRIELSVGYSIRRCLVRPLASVVADCFSQVSALLGSVNSRAEPSVIPHDNWYETAAARASFLIRSTIERTPFERCGVKCVERPRLSNRPWASMARIRDAVWPE
jgi:hypothetical protein